MKTKGLSKQVRHEVVEKHRSGKGYKNILKSLVIPFDNEWQWNDETGKSEIHYLEAEDLS